MSQLHADAAKPLPRWVVRVGSVLVGLHLLVVVVRVLAVQSGPWVLPGYVGSGVSTQEPPQFATTISRFTTRYYLEPLDLAHDYHFASNRTLAQAVYFEVRLRDENGEVFNTLQFPDEHANFWVRHRQKLLAESLGNDDLIEPLRSEKILAPGKHAPTVQIWDFPRGSTVNILKTISEFDIPRDRAVYGPTKKTLILVQAYARYLCREHGAASAELIRHSRNPILPATMFRVDNPVPGTYDEIINSFGEYPRAK